MTVTAYRTVIVGTDGSPTATSAVRAAAAVARSLAVPLAVSTGWRRDRDDAPPASEEARYPGGSAASHEATWATETASSAAAVARQAGVDDVVQHTPVGAPADTLIRLAEQHAAPLLVVGTAGLDRATERLVGNVPHQLTHHAPCDLLLVDSLREDHGHAWKRIALATDGSETAATACRRGLSLARSLDAEVTLLTVASDQEAGEAVLDRATSQLSDADGVGREVVVSRDTSKALIEAGTSYDLLVIGNKGMSGPSRLLGSVSNKVTHDVTTDLLLVNTTR